MTSKRHYLSKHNSILHNASSSIKRGDNVPDSLLTKEQLNFRRSLQSLRLRIIYKDEYGRKRKRIKIVNYILSSPIIG